MRTTIAAALIALASSAAFAPAAFATSLEDSAKALYKLYSKDRAICSAVAVSPTQLVTAAHCISPGLNIRVANEGFDRRGDKWEVRSFSAYVTTVVRTDKGGDVAFLELLDDSVSLNAIDIADAYTPAFGDRLLAIGYPRTDELTLTEGMFTAITDLPSLGMSGAFYKTTVPITGGSSGGALIRDFGDGDYRLIGLATGGYRDVSFQSYFSTVERVNDVVRGLISHGNVSTYEPPLDLPRDDMAIDGRG